MKKILYLLICSFVFSQSCKDKPTAPAFDNPLDRNNPATRGDPFELQAGIADGGVKLQWTAVDITTVTGYNIYRSEAERSGFSKIGSATAGQTSYVDKNVKNGHSYWYKVTACIAVGQESSQNNIQPVKIDVTGIPNRAPIASFTITPASGDIQTEFLFDASASYDFEDDISLLQVRWDWENDHTWDTDYSFTKTASHKYLTAGNRTVNLEIKDTDDNTNSTTKQILVEGTQGSITDIDGNTYKTIKIGNQWWTAENLKVTKYRNGDAIPNVTSNSDWTNLSTGAYCNYNNDVNNVATYGRLYNWYAVNDSRAIAPAGWHVPGDAEWKQLEMYLGMSQSEADDTGWRGTDEGGKLKEPGYEHWSSPNTGATNTSGFCALPGGYRDDGNGHCDGVGYSASFWSATELGSGYAWYRFLYYDYSAVSRYDNFKRYGFSVRLVRD